MKYFIQMKKEIKKSYVYMLTNSRGNVLYVGVTDDLKRRMYFHRNKLISGFTKKYNVHKLVYFEIHDSLELALVREKALKGMSRMKKNKVVESLNPGWGELRIPVWR